MQNKPAAPTKPPTPAALPAQYTNLDVPSVDGCKGLCYQFWVRRVCDLEQVNVKKFNEFTNLPVELTLGPVIWILFEEILDVMSITP